MFAEGDAEMLADVIVGFSSCSICFILCLHEEKLMKAEEKRPDSLYASGGRQIQIKCRVHGNKSALVSDRTHACIAHFIIYMALIYSYHQETHYHFSVTAVLR